MVSPLDGPGQPPGLNLPVPAEPRSILARNRGDDAPGGTQVGEFARREPARVEAVAVPISGSGDRTNPFLDRRFAPSRLAIDRPPSGFFAQLIGQSVDTAVDTADGTSSTGSAADAAARGARAYQDVQSAVDQAAARPRDGRLDITA